MKKYIVGQSGDFSYDMWPVHDPDTTQYFGVFDIEDEAASYLINLQDCKALEKMSQAQYHAQQAYNLRAKLSQKSR